MRRIKPLIPDQAILDHIQEITDSASTEYLSTRTLSNETISKYNYKPLKDIKVRESFGKCAYCESKILSNQPGELDHIKAKSQCLSKGEIGDIYSSSNLVMCCSTCNKKKSNFGITSPLLSPYTNHPEKHLTYWGDLIFSESDIGIKTILALDLNIRDDLIIKRRKRTEDIVRLIHLFNKEKDPEVKLLLKRRIAKETHRDKEFSLLALNIVDYLKILKN